MLDQKEIKLIAVFQNLLRRPVYRSNACTLIVLQLFGEAVASDIIMRRKLLLGTRSRLVRRDELLAGK
jgi:hypothetical protein